MENLSQPVESVAVPGEMKVAAYWRDHHIGSQVVLPAVEALQILARSKPAAWSADPGRQRGALLHHLLVIDPGAATVAVLQEHDRYADGCCLSRLSTLRASGNLKYRRRIEHLRVWFAPADRRQPFPGADEDGLSGADGAGGEPFRIKVGTAPDFSLAPAGAGRREGFPDSGSAAASRDVAVEREFSISAGRLYEELVPFGPAWRSARGDVLMTSKGISATVYGGDFPEAQGPLGSPFPLDGAMHAACAWGQRYSNRVLFPVGFDGREILRPTQPGETYACRIAPRDDEGSVLRFDLALYGPDGRPAEMIRGLQMREIPGGNLTPPAWVREGR